MAEMTLDFADADISVVTVMTDCRTGLHPYPTALTWAV